MRKFTIALNSIVVVFFTGFVAYTFFARQHLDAQARAFVTEKTVQYSEPIVELADVTLAAPGVKRLLTAEHNAAFRQEIDDYRRAPAKYFADLTRKMHAPDPQLQPLNPLIPKPLLQKIASIKERIRLFYDNTMSALITDLCIFSISNLCAGLIAFGLACRSREDIQKSIIWFSFLLFLTVLYCSYLYVDGLTFFRILFRTHPGWSYPLLMCVLQIGMFVDYRYSVLANEAVLRDGGGDNSTTTARTALQN